MGPLLMKQCFRCRRVLPLAQFYAHPQMADGHLGKCRECTRADVRENRARRRQQYNAYDRARSATPARRAMIEDYRARNPQKFRAHRILNNAVARGRVRRKPCEVCGDPRVDAHHEDYSQPLVVRWLCRRHHAAVHHARSA